MKKIIVFLLSSICMFANIGTVVDVVGSSTLVREGKIQNIVPKLQIEEHDILYTGKNAKLKLIFKDNTVVSLGEKTSFEVDSYFYEDNNKKSKIKFKVLKGFFKTVTGKISKVAPQRFKLQTKNATIGIRGTVFAAEVGDNVDVTICTDGTIVITTDTGTYELNKGSVARVSKNITPQISKYTQKVKQDIIKKSGWHGSMSEAELREYIKNEFKEPQRSQLLGAIENIFKKDSDTGRKRKNSKKEIFKDGDNLGFIDDISINDRDFDTLEQRTIEFYPEDLKDGKVIVEGLLESNSKTVSVDKLSVAVSIDGGESWRISKGHKEWSYSFRPKLGKTYEFSLKVVMSEDENTLPTDDTFDIPDILNIGGYILTLGDSVRFEDGKLSGNGSLFIPILQRISSDYRLNINFENLEFANNIVTSGQIEYNTNIDIQTEVVDVSITKLVISPVLEDNQIEGQVTFKGAFAYLGSIDLAESSKILPTSFSFEVPVDAKDFSVLPSHDVKMILDSGNIKINYSLGDTLPSLDITGLNARIDFGDILQSAVGSANSIKANLQSVVGNANAYTLNLTQNAKAYLLGQNIILNDLDLSFDMLSKKVDIQSSVDFSQYDNIIAKKLTGASLSASVSPSGFSGTVTASTNLDPITILARGGVGKDVILLFNNEPEISVSLDGTIPSFAFDELDAIVDFGDILKTAAGEASSVTANLQNIDGSYFLNLPQGTKAYLLGENIALEGVDLSFNMSDKSIHVNSSIDFSNYSNPIAKKLTNATLSADISPSGFSGTVTAATNTEAITILDRGGIGKDVRLIFNKEPEVVVSLNGTKPSFSFDNLDASIDFGNILQSAVGSTAPIIAKLKSIQDNANAYEIDLGGNTRAFLMGQKIILDGLNLSFDMAAKRVHVESSIDFSKYNNPVAKQITGATLSADISTAGFKGIITASTDIKPITIFDRGGASKDVRLVYDNSTSPTFSLDILGASSLPKIGIKNISASIDFGTLIPDAIAELHSVEGEAKDKLAWRISGTKNLISDKIKLLGLSGSFDLSDLSSPIVSLSSKVDLSQYGEMFKEVKNAEIKNATISKKGFSTNIKISLNLLPIWPEKEVILSFVESPVLHVKVDKSGLDIGFSNLSAQLNFGLLLNGAVANITRVVETGQSEFEETKEKVENDFKGSGVFDWSLDGSYPLYNNQIDLNGLRGTIDFSDLSDPKIVLNATADLSEYSSAFRYIHSASIENAKISKLGFEGTIKTGLHDIDIWKEKSVKLLFDKNKPLALDLKLTSRGVKFGLHDISAELDFGDILDGEVISLEEGKNGFFDWSLSGRKKLIDGVHLDGLSGKINLSNFSSPVIKLNGNVDFDQSIGFDIQSASFQNATISRSGFSGDITANIGNIDVWQEKRVKLKFDSQNPPMLSLKVSREGFDVGVKNLNASLDFGDLLGGEVLQLIKAVPSAEDLEKYSQNLAIALKRGKYSWSLEGSHDLISDGDKKVIIDGIGGEIDLKSLSNPIINFHASADFTQYLSEFSALGTVALEDAKISKDGIDWNFTLQNAGAEFTILDLGTRDEDVRAEISNLNAHAGSESAGVDSANGKLYFGKLFDGTVEPISLYYSNEGIYTFETSQILTYKKSDTTIVFSGISGSVEKQSDGSYKVKFGGKIGVKADVFTKIGIQTLDFNNLEVSNTGMSGSVLATLNNKRYIILNNKVTLILNKVGVSVNSNWDIPFKMTTFDGKVDLSEIFDGTAQAGLSYVNSNIHWSFDRTININKFEFKGLNGGFDFAGTTPYVSFGGNFGYTGISGLNIALDNFKVNRFGPSGTIGLATGSSFAFPGITGLKIIKMSTTFNRSEISGSFGVQYNKDKFLGSTKPFELKLSASIDRSGIKELGISSSALKNFTVPNFAKFSFDEVTANPNFNHFWIKLSGDVKPDNSMFSAVSSVEFKNLKISQNGVTIDSAGVDFAVSGASASLGGFGLSIERLGLGFKGQKLYISTKGTLSLKVAEAGAGLKIYSDGDIEVNSIKVLVNNPGVTFGGEIAWYKNDPVFGNGFGTESPLHLSIASLFSVKGEFKIGEKDGLYWMAKAQGGLGTGIPLGPVTIYELGGGAAYGMSLQKQGSGANTTYRFVPNGGDNIVIILSSLIGTPDLGFTWHGQIDLNVDSAGQIIMQGNTYILSALRSSPAENRKVYGTIILGMSPASLHITGGANINYRGIGVEGGVDIMFAGDEKHVFIGTDSHAEGFHVTTPLGNVKVTIFGMGPQGYFMIDTRRLAFGASYHFAQRVSFDLWGPDPYIEIGADVRGDALIQYNPFFMDLSAEASAYLEAGYGRVWSGRLTAGLAIKFRAPNPSYAKVKAYVDIPVYGNASFTAYFPSRPSSSSADNLPSLINHVEPYESSNVSLMPTMKIVTTFNNDGSHFDLGDMGVTQSSGKIKPGYQGYITTHEKLYYTSKVEHIVLRDITDGWNRIIDVQRTQAGENVIELLPKYTSLEPGHTYKLTGRASLSYYYVNAKATIDGRADMYDAINDTEAYLRDHKEILNEGLLEIKAEDFEKEFTVRPDFKMEFNEVIKYVYPNNLQEDVLEQEKIILYYTDAVKHMGVEKNLVRNYKVKVTNAKNKAIEGEFFYNDDDGVAKSIFQPNEDLRIYHFCVDNTTGEVRETILSGGEYLNPFKVYSIDGASQENETNVPDGYSPISFPSSTIDLGDFIQSNEDGRYSYFTNNTYNIIITDEATGQIAYFSSFKIKYNIPSRMALRRFDVLKDRLQVSLELSRNVDHANQFRMVVDDGLHKLGIGYSGVISKVITSWTTENGLEEVIQLIDSQYQNINLNNDGLELLSAKIRYYNKETDELLYTLDIDDISDAGEYSTAAQEEAQHNATKVIKVGKITEEAVGGFGNADGMPGASGYGQAGGGFNPSGEFGDVGVKAQVGAEFNLGGEF